MKSSFRIIVAQFSAAWDIFLTIPLPKFLHGDRKDLETIDGKPALAVPMLPLIGGVIGYVLYIPLWLICSFGRPIAAGILGITIIPLIAELLTGGKELRALCLFLEARRSGKDVEEALTPPAKESPLSAPPVLLFTFYILRMIMFGVLAYFNAGFWFIVVFCGSFYLRAELSLLNIPGEFGKKALLRTPDNMKKHHTYLTLAVMILAGLIMDIPLTLIGFLVTLLIAFFAKGACLESLSGVNKFAIRVFSYSAEIVLLFIGVLLYAKP